MIKKGGKGWKEEKGEQKKRVKVRVARKKYYYGGGGIRGKITPYLFLFHLQFFIYFPPVEQF